MWIDEVPAVGASEQSSCVHRPWIGVCVSKVELFLKCALTPGATEGSIECLESFALGCKDILVPLDSFEY